jgi:glycosyltransferase involved in cell wall biosynthesis
MKNVLVRAPLLSQSGYGVHSRQIFKFCEAQKDWNITTQVLPWGITPWNVNDTDEGGLYGRIMSTSKPSTQKFDISFQIQLPHEWDENLAHFNVGITAGVETTKCSQDWSGKQREKMDLVIVPSNFTKETLTRTAGQKNKTPVEVLPEAYFYDLLCDPTDDPLKDITTEKNFLTIGTLTSDNPEADRKNLISSIIWFMKAFEGKKDVGLIVKTSRGRDTTIDRELVRKTLRQVRTAAKIDLDRAPKLYMMHGTMTREEMRNVYRSKKLIGYMSATRGEGFGLPLLEAAVSELPVVATNWSAHTEFLDGPSFQKVKFDMCPVPPSRIDGTIFVAGSAWANPREGNFCRKMKSLYENPKQFKTAAKNLSKTLTKTHSLEALQEKFENIMRKYL